MIANVVGGVLALGRRVTGTAVPATCDVTPATCDVTIDEMGAYLSGDLAGGREQFIAHIRSCSECHDKLLVLELSLSLDQAAIMAESPARRAVATVAATLPRRAVAALLR
jgi:hypothetical protein